ncbi:hypothetical protein AB0M44_36940, partial [Streptosporangium subroseum]|uniref:hypothetical protein n=1 Tax=Streptosporangium subroseum TaxID=106412 RepID=UPI003426EC02
MCTRRCSPWNRPARWLRRPCGRSSGGCWNGSASPSWHVCLSAADPLDQVVADMAEERGSLIDALDELPDRPE